MTHYEKKRDVVFSLVATTGSALGLMQAFSYPPESSNFPKFLLWAMLLFAVVLLIKSVRVRPAGDAASSTAQAVALRENLGTAAVVICGSGLYALGILHIGYFVSTAVFFLAAMVLYGKNKVLSSVLALMGFVGVMYALFVWFLGMRLPEGLLF